MPTSTPISRPIINFAPFQLDLRAGLLRRDGAALHVRPKTFAVLQHLAERPGELVTKQALLDAVWGDVVVSEDVVRMRQLAERLDAPLLRFRAMEGLFTGHTMRAELMTARALGEEMIALAGQLGTPGLAATNPTLGSTLMHLGDLEAAHDHARRARALCDPEQPAIHGISSCVLLAATCAHRGRVAEARALNREAVALAGTLGTPYFRGHATTFAAGVCQLLRDVPGTRSLAEEALHLATECGFAVFRVTATMFRGWCDVVEGRVAEGLTAVRGAFEDYAKSGQRIATTSYSLLLAEAHLAGEDVPSATEVLDAALAFSAETGERSYEHELYRLKGECVLASATAHRRKAEATAYFERAIAIAGERKALLYELRAATSLYRVRKSARERLARLVDRFDEEDDCVDLRAAQALLGVPGR